MKKIILLFSVMCGFFVFGEVPQKPVFKILDMAHKKAPSDNVLFSPLSLQECFGMISCGAGKVSSGELSTVLGLDAVGSKALREARKSLAKSEKAEFLSCNTLLVDKRLNFYQDFVNRAVYFYGGKILKADFNRPKECAQLLNKLVKEQSRGVFDNVFVEKDFESDPLTVLMNVLCFKSKWYLPFDQFNTQKQVFNTSAEEKYQVDMMLGTQQVPYYNDGKLHGIVLSYRDPRFKMLFLMPIDPAVKVTAVTEKLAAEGISEIIKQASAENETIIQLPKLDLFADNDLVPLLQEAGMKHIFDPSTGDLDKMVKGIPLFIDKARQLVKLKLDESGTEMAAATFVMAKTKAIRRENNEINNFHADRPYVIVLFDMETSAILLCGVISKPAAVIAAQQ